MGILNLISGGLKQSVRGGTDGWGRFRRRGLEDVGRGEKLRLPCGGNLPLGKCMGRIAFAEKYREFNSDRGYENFMPRQVFQHQHSHSTIQTNLPSPQASIFSHMTAGFKPTSTSSGKHLPFCFWSRTPDSYGTSRNPNSKLKVPFHPPRNPQTVPRTYHASCPVSCRSSAPRCFTSFPPSPPLSLPSLWSQHCNMRSSDLVAVVPLFLPLSEFAESAMSDAMTLVS